MTGKGKGKEVPGGNSKAAAGDDSDSSELSLNSSTNSLPGLGSDKATPKKRVSASSMKRRPSADADDDLPSVCVHRGLGWRGAHWGVGVCGGVVGVFVTPRNHP